MVDGIDSFIEDSAEWVYGVSLSDIPHSALLSAKVLVIDTIAAALSSLNTTHGRRICRELRGILNVPELFSTESVLLDHDSTLLYYGHLGHGVVSATLTSGLKDVDGAGLVESVITGVEVGARLAASLSLSRTRGQMLSVAHSIAVAASLGKLLGLKRDTLNSALSLSLAYIVKPTRAGFTTTAKVFAAANPLSHGFRALKLAMAGGRGVVGVLNSLLEEWGGVYLKAPLDGFGARWHIETVSVKPWPACSYAQTAVDAALELSSLIDVDSIREVRLEANALTYYMDRLFEPPVKQGQATFTTLQFYTPYIVAYILANGEFGRRAYEQESMEDSRVWRIAGLVRRAHDPSLTSIVIREPLPFGVAINEIGAFKTLILLSRLLGIDSLRIISKYPGVLRGVPIDEIDFNGARKVMPVNLVIKTRDGTFEAGKEVVKGFHGTGIESKIDVAMEKLSDASRGLLGGDEFNMLRDVLLRIDKAGSDEVEAVSNIMRGVLEC